MDERKTLHALVDQLPKPELLAARRYLEYLRHTADPLRRILESAPVDDEPMTEDDSTAIRAGSMEESQRGYTSHTEIKRLLNQTD